MVWPLVELRYSTRKGSVAFLFELFSRLVDFFSIYILQRVNSDPSTQTHRHTDTSLFSLSLEAFKTP